MPSISVDDPTRETGGDPEHPSEASGQSDERALAGAGAPLPEGSEVGRYLVLGRLGAGGMGDVYAAYDPELDRKVALKLVRIDVAAESAQAQTRLLHEAKALAKLSHRNVVAVFDAGAHEDRVFVAMEFVGGRTLTQWASDATRTWREVLDVLLQAGRGLEAAHAAGIVHRDFKPSNVMVDGDGGASGKDLRARVLDFGLAQGLDVGLGLPLTTSSMQGISQSQVRRRKLSLTQTGVVVGTPSYMAPEQFAGESIDARTDQFSFCVVLYRLIYGERPFPGEGFDELQESVLGGTLRDPGRVAGVAGRLRTIIARGLQRDPDERYASMTDLLLELERVVGARRRRITVAAAATVTVGLATLAWSSAREAPVCQGAHENLQGVWDDASRARAAQAFAAVGRAYADDAWRIVEPRIDAFAEAWVHERADACLATQVRHEQSEELMDLRMACLDRQLLEADALVELFGEADAQVAEKAIGSVEGLPDPAACADVRALTQGVAPPPADQAQEVEDIDAGLARVHALMLSGKYKQSLGDAQGLLERAQTTGYGPSIARGALYVGQVHERLSQLEPAEEAYMLAMERAAAAGDAMDEARAIGGMCSLLGLYGNDLQAALRHCRHAAALFEHLGDPEPHRSNLELHRANALYRNRKLDEAKVVFEAVLERTKDEPAAQPIRLGAISNLSGVLGMQGELEAAMAMAEEGAEWVRVHWGEHHPSRAFLLTNMGAICLQMGRYDEAVEALERAATIYEGAFGERHADTARVYHNLGVAKMRTGDAAGALERYRQALEIKRSVYPDGSPSVAHTANNIADVLLRLDRPEDALEAADEAIAMFEQTQGPDAPDLLIGVTTKVQILLALDRPVDPSDIERGITLAQDPNTDAEARARFRWIAAKILWSEPSQRRRALQLAEAARDYFETVPDGMAEELADIEGWLAKRR